MSLLVRTSTDAGALLVRDTDDPFALAVTESTSPLALRVRESTSPLAMRVRGLFSPASLPGLAAWYDASDSSTVLTTVSPDVPASNGQTVRRWLDKSGNNRHLEQGDLVNQPTFSGGAVTSNGGDFWMQSNFTLAQPITVFAIMRLADTASSYGLYDGATSRVHVFFSTGQLTPQIFAGVSLAATSAITLNVPSLIGGLYNGASSINFSNRAELSGNAGVNALTNLQVFRNSGAGRFSGTLSELIFYSGALSSADRNRLKDYATRRHGTP
jgi:hypothetical protein